MWAIEVKLWRIFWMAISVGMRMIGKMRMTDLPGEIFHNSFRGRLLQMEVGIHSLLWLTPMVSIACQSYGVHAKDTLRTGIFSCWINICTLPAMTESKLFSRFLFWTTIGMSIWSVSQATTSTTINYGG